MVDPQAGILAGPATFRVSASMSWVQFIPSSVRASAVGARTSRGGLHPAGSWQEDAVLWGAGGAVCSGAARGSGGSLRGVRRPGTPEGALSRRGAGQDSY